MDDVAPPQDANPSTADEYAKDGAGEEPPLANGGSEPTDDAAADPAAAADGAGGSAAADEAMLTDNAEEGGVPSGGASRDGGGGGGGGGGNLYLRPIFFGNLSHNCLAADVENVFKNPTPGSMDNGEVKAPIPVDRVVSGIFRMTDPFASSILQCPRSPTPPLALALHRISSGHETRLLLRLPQGTRLPGGEGTH